MFNRKLHRPGQCDYHMSVEDRAERDRWHRLFLSIDRATPAGRPLPHYDRLTDEQVFEVARSHDIDLAALGF